MLICKVRRGYLNSYKFRGKNGGAKDKFLKYSYFTLLHFTSLSFDGGGSGNGGMEYTLICFLFVLFFSIECGGPVLVPRKEGVTPWRWPPLFLFLSGGPRVQHYNITTTYLLRLALSFIIYHLSFIKSYFFTPESMIIAFSIISIIKFPRFNLAAVPVGKKKEKQKKKGRLKVFGKAN